MIRTLDGYTLFIVGMSAAPTVMIKREFFMDDRPIEEADYKQVILQLAKDNEKMRELLQAVSTYVGIDDTDGPKHRAAINAVDEYINSLPK